jgi:hypothetical protein
VACSKASAPPPEAAYSPPVPVSPGGRRAVDDHVHYGSLELSAFQGFDGGRRSLFFKFDQGKALGTAASISGEANGPDLAIDREDLPQITIRDLWGQVAYKQGSH